ncbi:MAG: hypothetical protein Q7S27_03905 [Nanoarchaeota archaeon]|nr:hypothetical protein [Nanoarchaeota archaeon]
MVLGYDMKRPSEKNYHDFMFKFVEGLRGIGSEEISFMVYGSFIRGDCIYGRSDIDALLILPGEVVLNKDILRKSAEIYTEANKENNVPFQVTVSDLKTMQEGTFNSYEPNFKSYFDKEGKVVVGKDYRESFRYQLPNLSDQTSLRFNLRKCRAGLLYSLYDEDFEYTAFLKKFNKNLDAISRGSKQILTLMDGGVRANRFSALEELGNMFPDLDLDPLRKIRQLYNNLNELDAIYKDSKYVLKVWNESVCFFESLIKSYLDWKKEETV